MAEKINLGGRLLRIAGMVLPGASIIDVGTDHAYLPAYLLQNGIVKNAKASDISLGPIRKAEATIHRYQLQGRLELKHCPGLRDFSEEDADTIIIAGLGGDTIAMILDEAPWLKSGKHRLLLQPMTSNDDLRRSLFQTGFSIRDETLAMDAGRLYTILDVRGGGKTGADREPFERFVSRHVLKEELAGAYLQRCLKRLMTKREGLSGARALTPNEDVVFLNHAISGITELKREWDQCRQ